MEYPTWIYPDNDVAKGYVLNVFERDGLMVETKTYQDGTVVTGVPPLPALSPAEQDALVLPALTAPPPLKRKYTRKNA